MFVFEKKKKTAIIFEKNFITIVNVVNQDFNLTSMLEVVGFCESNEQKYCNLSFGYGRKCCLWWNSNSLLQKRQRPDIYGCNL